MLTSTSALLLACTAFVAADLIGMRRYIGSDLTTLADVMGENVSAALVFRDAETAKAVLSALHSKNSIVAAMIYGKDGRPFVGYRSVGGDISRIRLEVTRQIVFDGETIGRITLATDLRDITARLKNYGAGAAGILAMSMIVALTVGSRLQRVISDPIVSLANVMSSVQRNKNYALRAPVHVANDEVGALIQGFNEMLAEVERRDDDVSRHKQMILDSAGEGIFGLDARGVVTFINPSGAQMLGETPERLLGVSMHAVLHPDGRGAAPIAECSICSATLQPPMRIGKTDTFVDRSGRAIPVEYTASTFRTGNGANSGVVVTFRDISERLAVDRMKDEFVSTVSHELRTPLTSIRGALGILASGMIGSVTERAQRMLDIAVSNTDRLVRLINDILDLERMASGRVELNHRLVDAADLIAQAAESMQALADRAGVSLIAEPVHAPLWLDGDRILQTLTNLLSNAIKFSARETVVRIGGEQDAHTFTFVVADQGRGIPSDKIETIFERFKQVDASDSRDKGGTGLGLAISRSIAVAHGGSISAESTLGQGSTFRVSLPRRTNISSPASDSSRATILLGDVDGTLTSEMIALIKRQGFRAIVVPAGSDILEKAAEVQPNAILLDMLAPTESRWHIVRRLRNDERTRDIPIIVASAQWPAASDRDAQLVAAWLQKPVDENHLVATLTRACAQSVVLLAEDDIDLAGVIATALQSHGITTIHAANGREALDAVQQRAPDMVILDIVLPELDGFAVVEWLKRDPAFERLPLLVYSAQEVSAYDQERLRLGPTEFLTKTRVSLEQFEQHVVRLLHRLSQQEVSGAA